MKFILGLWIEMVAGTWDDWSASGGKLQGERGLGAMHSDGVRAATAEQSLKGETDAKSGPRQM